MRLYRLRKIDNKGYDPVGHEACLVRARSALRAREIAYKWHRGESAWLDPTQSHCSSLHVEGHEGIILVARSIG